MLRGHVELAVQPTATPHFGSCAVMPPVAISWRSPTIRIRLKMVRPQKSSASLHTTRHNHLATNNLNITLTLSWLTIWRYCALKISPSNLSYSNPPQARLESHAQAFEGLLSLIPANEYYSKDNSVRL